MPDGATLRALLAKMAKAEQDESRVAKRPDTRMTIKPLTDAESSLMDLGENEHSLGIPALDYVREKTPSLVRSLALDPGIAAGKKLSRGDVGGAALDIALNVPEALGPLAKVAGLGMMAMRTGRAADAGEKALLKALKKSPKKAAVLKAVEDPNFDWYEHVRKNVGNHWNTRQITDDGMFQSHIDTPFGKRTVSHDADWNSWSVEPNAEILPPFVDEAVEPIAKERAAPTAAVGSPRKTVSTRVPTAVKATEDPMKEKLLVGLESSRMDPKAFETNARLVSRYPNMPAKLEGAPADEVAEQFVKHAKDNLLWLHDQVPEDVRNRSKQWYAGARKIVDDWSGKHQIPDVGVAGVLAVLSPQKDWFMNTSLGDRVINTVRGAAVIPWSREMSETANRIYAKPQYAQLRANIEGRRLADLTDPFERAAWVRAYDEAHNARHYPVVHPEGEFGGPVLTQKGVPGKVAWGSLPEIAKAINILDDPSLENVSKNLGGQHKVRSFFNNIIDPNSLEGHVTADTHAVAANMLRPLSGQSTEVAHNFGGGGASSSSVFGSKGTYGLNAEPYREAARERGVLPREMQSITWEAVRGLFPSTFKSQARNVADIEQIWNRYRNGELSLDDARRAVVERSGGIRNPDWYEQP